VVEDACCARKVDVDSFLAQRKAGEDGGDCAEVVGVCGVWDELALLRSKESLHPRRTTSACLLCSRRMSLESRSPITISNEGCLARICCRCSSLRTSPTIEKDGCLATRVERVWPPMYPVIPVMKMRGAIVGVENEMVPKTCWLREVL